MAFGSGKGKEFLESGLMEYRLIAVGDALLKNGERAMMRMNTSPWELWSSFLDAELDPRLYL